MNRLRIVLELEPVLSARGDKPVRLRFPGLEEILVANGANPECIGVCWYSLHSKDIPQGGYLAADLLENDEILGDLKPSNVHCDSGTMSTVLLAASSASMCGAQLPKNTVVNVKDLSLQVTFLAARATLCRIRLSLDFEPDVDAGPSES